jgi:hypothetical protein
MTIPANSLVPSPQPLAPPRSGHNTPELREAFTDFVGQTFFGELLKQMRATVDKPKFFHGGMGEDIFQSQLDQILVERISDQSAATFTEPMYQLMLARRP